jgi:hypothetical protein
MGDNPSKGICFLGSYSVRVVAVVGDYRPKL